MQDFTKKDKYGNTPFTTVVYRGQTIDFYDDDNGQSVYFYYGGEEFGCGSFNPNYEDEMHTIVDNKLDFVESITEKDISIDIMKDDDGYWFHAKCGAPVSIIHAATIREIRSLASKEIDRFAAWLDNPNRKEVVFSDLLKRMKQVRSAAKRETSCQTPRHIL